jgi:hypothetical protein
VKQSKSWLAGGHEPITVQGVAVILRATDLTNPASIFYAVKFWSDWIWRFFCDSLF